MNLMETRLNSSPGAEARGKVQSEEETPSAAFLALLGLEVEEAMPVATPLALEVQRENVPEVLAQEVQRENVPEVLAQEVQGGNVLEVLAQDAMGKKVSGPEGNWGGVSLAYTGKSIVGSKERVSGKVSEAAELDVPKEGVSVVEKGVFPEAAAKLVSQEQLEGVPVALAKEGEPIVKAAEQIVSQTGSESLVQQVNSEDVRIDLPKEGKVAEQDRSPEMTMMHRRIPNNKDASEEFKIPVFQEVSSEVSVVSEPAEDGLSVMTETADVAVHVEEMVHRVPSMGLQSVAVGNEESAGFVKKSEQKTAFPMGGDNQVLGTTPSLADPAPPAMLFEEVPLRMEEVVVPLAQVQVKRGDSVLKRDFVPEASTALEAVQSKVVTLPVTPAAPMNIPSSPQVSEATMRLEQLTEQFDQRLLSMVQRNEKVMRITMEPATMGKMTVLCREENSLMTVEIHVQNPTVRELIARQEDDIRRVMQECNVDVGGFDVFMSEQREDPRQSASGRSNSRWNSHGISPASKEVEGVGETPVYFRKNAASWIA